MQGPHGSPSKGLSLATLYTHRKLNTALPCHCLLSSLAALKHFPWPWKGSARQNYSILKPHPQGLGTADPLQKEPDSWPERSTLCGRAGAPSGISGREKPENTSWLLTKVGFL